MVVHIPVISLLLKHTCSGVVVDHMFPVEKDNVSRGRQELLVSRTFYSPPAAIASGYVPPDKGYPKGGVNRWSHRSWNNHRCLNYWHKWRWCPHTAHSNESWLSRANSTCHWKQRRRTVHHNRLPTVGTNVAADGNGCIFTLVNKIVYQCRWRSGAWWSGLCGISCECGDCSTFWGTLAQGRKLDSSAVASTSLTCCVAFFVEDFLLLVDFLPAEDGLSLSATTVKFGSAFRV